MPAKPKESTAFKDANATLSPNWLSWVELNKGWICLRLGNQFQIFCSIADAI